MPILQNKMRVIIAVVFKINLNAAKPPEQSGLGGNIVSHRSMYPRWTVGMDSDVTRIFFFPWMVPVYHVASSRRSRTSETVRPATVPRTANEIWLQTCT